MNRIIPSTNGGHKSASERRIAQLEAERDALRATAFEFNAFLNYMMTYHPTDPETPEVVVIERPKLISMTNRTVVSTQEGSNLVFRFSGPAPTKSSLILPG